MKVIPVSIAIYMEKSRGSTIHSGKRSPRRIGAELDCQELFQMEYQGRGMMPLVKIVNRMRESEFKSNQV